MTKAKALEDINETIDMIRNAANPASSGVNAEHVKNTVQMWIDQLGRDIEVYNEIEERGN